MSFERYLCKRVDAGTADVPVTDMMFDYIAELEADREKAWQAALVAGNRIAELEAELDGAVRDYAVAARNVRPADVVVIDGQQWRYDPSEAIEWGASDGTRGIDCTLEPVEDTDG